MGGVEVSRARRHQKGCVVLRSGSWYLRVYDDTPEGRRQVNLLLARKDEKFHSKTCKPLRDLVAQELAKVNAKAADAAASPTVAEFWQGSYLPFVEQTKRPSTVRSYKQIWESRLKAHFDGQALDGYRPLDATNFLTELAKSGVGRNTLSHIRNLMSAVFSFACATGKADRNPIREARSLAKPKSPAQTAHYSIKEVDECLKALSSDPQAALAFSLAAVLGMRPGEIAGLDWSDANLEAGLLHIRRAAWRGHVNPPKTESSVRSLPLVAPVKGLLAAWRERCGSPSSGWVFPGRGKRPMDIPQYARRVIKPLLGDKYKGLYAGRRAAGTALWQLTGSVEASQQALGHRTAATTLNHYKKAVDGALDAGMRAYERELAKKGD